MVRLIPSFERNDAGWDGQQNYRVYEDAERAKGKGGGFFGPIDQAGAEVAFNIRIMKAQAMDRARRALIRAAHTKHEDAMGFSFVKPEAFSRSIDGADDAPDSAIKL